MRWKLLLIASLIATIVGAGATFGIISAISRSTQNLAAPLPSMALIALILPLSAITFASIFVYRHTSRRRKLQAMLTAMLSMLLTLTIFILGALVFPKPLPPQQPILSPTPPRNIG